MVLLRTLYGAGFCMSNCECIETALAKPTISTEELAILMVKLLLLRENAM